MNTTSATGDDSLELIFRALGERTRLRILFLLEDGELCVGDIVSALRAPQAGISRHLGYLQRAGLVSVRQQGLWRFYQLARLDASTRKPLVRALFACRAAVPEAMGDGARLRALRESGGCCPQ